MYLTFLFMIIALLFEVCIELLAADNLLSVKKRVPRLKQTIRD